MSGLVIKVHLTNCFYTQLDKFDWAVKANIEYWKSVGIYSHTTASRLAQNTAEKAKGVR